MKKQRTERRRLWTTAALLAAWLVAVQPATQAADAAPPAPRWESTANLGFTLTSGNSESVLFTAGLATQRKEPKNEYIFGASVAYGEAKPGGNDDADMEKNTDSARALAQWNHLFSEKAYMYARADLVHDDIANVMYRVMLSPGAGYYFIKTEKTTLAGEVGPGYVFERTLNRFNVSTNIEPDGILDHYDNNDYATIRFAERFQHQISKSARVWQTLEYLPEITDWAENWILNAEVGIAADIVKNLAVSVVLQDSYDNDPPEGRENNDLRVIAGVQYKF